MIMSHHYITLCMFVNECILSMFAIGISFIKSDDSHHINLSDEYRARIWLRVYGIMTSIIVLVLIPEWLSHKINIKINKKIMKVSIGIYSAFFVSWIGYGSYLAFTSLAHTSYVLLIAFGIIYSWKILELIIIFYLIHDANMKRHEGYQTIP